MVTTNPLNHHLAQTDLFQLLNPMQSSSPLWTCSKESSCCTLLHALSSAERATWTFSSIFSMPQTHPSSNRKLSLYSSPHSSLPPKVLAHLKKWTA